MVTLRIFIVPGILCMLLGACSEDNINKLRNSSAILDSILSQAPIERINLDVLPPQILTPENQNHIYGKPNPDLDSILVSFNTFALLVNNRAHFLDLQQKAVIHTDDNGFINAITHRPGKGPGEYVDPRKIFKNDNYIFLHDGGQSKILLYNYDWSFSESITIKGSASNGGINNASEKFILIPEDNYHSNLIQVYTPLPHFQKLHSFFPRLIPFRKQPGAYNRAKAETNDKIIATLYNGLPFIFIFDTQFEHLKTLHFEATRIDTLDSPSLEPVPDTGYQSAIGVPVIFTSLLILENNDLIISSLNTIFFLEADSDLSYKLVSVKNLHHANEEKQKEEKYGFTISSIDQEGDFILINSLRARRAYKFHLDTLRN